MNFQPRLTVCICTHNGWRTLPLVLDALKAQVNCRDMWKLLIIDNASTDNTSEKTAAYVKENFPAPVKIVAEPVPGTSYARRRGAMETDTPYLCFLDDDTVPEPQFIKQASGVFDLFPKAGVVGGRVLAHWDGKPTALAEAVAAFALAICDHGPTAFCYQGISAGPVTAGMCIRTELIQRIYGDEKFVHSITGGVGAKPLRGEDTAIVVKVVQAGYECWYDPDLVIHHHLPAGRTHKDYLLRLYEGIGVGQASVRYIYDWKVRTPLAWIVAAKDASRWGANRLRRGKSNKFDEQLAGDLADLESSLIVGRMQRTIRFWA